MCTGILEILKAVSTGFSVVSQVAQGRQQQRAYEAQAQQVAIANAQAQDALRFQAEQARADAQAEREAGEVAATHTRRSGQKVQSEATAALAASGVEVGAGTPLLVEEQIARTAEEDALNQILYGVRRGSRLDQAAEIALLEGAQGAQAAQTQIGFLQEAGRNARTGSLLSAGGTILSGWSSVAKGRRAVPAQQPPAPVEDRVLRIG